MSVVLGEKYRDSLTGIEGVAVCSSNYLYGCVRVCLEAVKDNEIKEWWFDEQRLIETSATQEPVRSGATSGGPRTPPPGRSVPSTQ